MKDFLEKWNKNIMTAWLIKYDKIYYNLENNGIYSLLSEKKCFE